METEDLLSERKVLNTKDEDCGCNERAQEIGGGIPLQSAALWTKTYRERYPNQIKGHFFGRVVIEELLAQEKCAGIRMYYGIKQETQQTGWDNFLGKIITFLQNLKSTPIESKQLIIVGADENLNDQLPKIEDELEKKSLISDKQLRAMGLEIRNTAVKVVDSSLPCPNGCGGGNVLN